MRLNTYQLRLWSVRVRWRDRKCQLCGSRERLHAHHLNSKSYFPSEAYDLANGVALCGSANRTGNNCHVTFHTLFMRGFRKKCTREDYDRWRRVVAYARAMTGEVAT